MNLSLLEGNKVFEIKDNRVNKGHSASKLIGSNEYDFIMGMGDDRTDEDLFAALPKSAYSIKVGLGATNARYRVSSWKSVRALIKRLRNNFV